MISVPLRLLTLLAALFSGYHVVLGVFTLRNLDAAAPGIVALALYVVATIASLWPTERVRLSGTVAAFDLAVALALPLLVTSQLDPAEARGYDTWYVAAVGTLMTIAAARRQLVVAWLGVAVLSVQTVAWAGPFALVTAGVIGSIVWVAIAHALTAALASAGRETRRYVRAEREAAEWQAAQDAHLFEGRIRLVHTSRVAAPMLRTIIGRAGSLTPAERDECRLLEATLRDEIRGRMLLNDAVRLAIRTARVRGAFVSLLDEGGIDSLEEPDRDHVLSQVADAVAASAANRLVIRTATEDSPIAVTVVGLIVAPDEAAGATPDADDDAEVELWLAIPRP